MNQKHSDCSQMMCENAASRGSCNPAGLLQLQTLVTSLENRALEIHVQVQRKYFSDDFGNSRSLPFYPSVVLVP